MSTIDFEAREYGILLSNAANQAQSNATVATQARIDAQSARDSSLTNANNAAKYYNGILTIANAQQIPVSYYTVRNDAVNDPKLSVGQMFVSDEGGTMTAYRKNVGSYAQLYVVVSYGPFAASTGASLIGMTSRTGNTRVLSDRLLDSVNLFDCLSSAQAADVRSGTASIDIAPQLQAMINTLNAAGGGLIKYDGGCALLSTPIRLYNNVTLVGGGGGVNGTIETKGGASFKQAAAASGSVVDGVVVSSGGSGYTSATVTFSNGATGIAWVSGGSVVSVSITDCGIPTTSTITGTINGDGSNAVISVKTSVPMFYQSGTYSQISMENITLIGNFSATSSGFVLSYGTPFFHNFRAYGFGLSAWRRMAGAGGHVVGGHIFGMNRTGMSPGTISYYCGSIDDGGNDLQLSDIEAGSGFSGDSTNLWNSAFHLRGTGSATQLSNIVAEGGDVGILCSGQNVMMTNTRADINYGHGVWIHRTNPVLSPPSYTKIWGLWCHRNGRYTANTYDNLRIEPNDSIIGTQVRGYSSTTAGSDGVKHRYGMYNGDLSSDVSAYSDVGAGTAKYIAPNNYNPGPAQSRTSLTTLAAVATVNVTGQREFRLSNGGSPTTVSLMTGCFHGDELVIIPTASNITLQQGTNSTQGGFMLAGGQSRLLTPWVAVYLRNSAGTWYEVQSWVKQVAISSPTADVNSLKTAVDAIRTALITLGLTS